jgi:hypothetical protein
MQHLTKRIKSVYVLPENNVESTERPSSWLQRHLQPQQSTQGAEAGASINNNKPMRL